MISIALIAEGVTDYATLEAILNEHYIDSGDVDVNLLMPLRDATDESRNTFGGWERVLEYCALADFEKILTYSHFVVIQIDTDCAEHSNFGVPLTVNGVDRPQLEIINDVIAVITRKIDSEMYSEFKHQIIFAISVHSLECWFLPLYGKTKSSRSKIKNCASELSNILNRQNDTYEKNYEIYRGLAKIFKKTKKGIIQCAEINESFRIFISKLPKI